MISRQKRKWHSLRRPPVEPSAATTLIKGRLLVVSCVMRMQYLEHCGRKFPNTLEKWN